MSAPISRRIELFARAHGISYREAAAHFGKRSGAKRRAKARRKSEAEINEERFEKMRAMRGDLYD